MRRSNWRFAAFTAVSGAIGLSVLAGCTTGQYNASNETARYLQNARGRYVIPGPPGDPWGPYIKEASRRYDIPETWIRALMRQESGGNLYQNGRLITSGAGAMGLMQVMPGTYAELRARHNLGPDPFDPHDNIMAGVGYMREMYDMYGSPGFLAAYNAGPNRLDDYLSNQRALPDETRHYVAVIGPSLASAQPHVQSPAQQFAMNQLPVYIPAGPRFGYGSSQIPMTQMAAAPTYTPVAAQPRAVAWSTPPAPVYTQPAPQPRALAWAAPPAQVYTQPAPRAPALAWSPPPAPVYTQPVQQPRALAWAEPPRPVYTPASHTREDADDDSPARRPRVVAQSRSFGSTRVALAIPPVPPVQHSGGGLHLISSAMAAETFPVRHHGHVTPASYPRGERPRAQEPAGKQHASGPARSSSGCHKDSHGRSACAPDKI